MFLMLPVGCEGTIRDAATQKQWPTRQTTAVASPRVCRLPKQRSWSSWQSVVADRTTRWCRCTVSTTNRPRRTYASMDNRLRRPTAVELGRRGVDVGRARRSAPRRKPTVVRGRRRRVWICPPRRVLRRRFFADRPHLALQRRARLTRVAIVVVPVVRRRTVLLTMFRSACLWR